MRLRPLMPAAVLLLAPVLAACGDDGDGGDSADPTPTETSASSEPTTATSATAASETTPTVATPETSDAPPLTGALPAACDVITSDDVAKALGVSFGAAKLGGGSTSEQGVDWKSDNCSFEADDLVEVSVKLTGPDDFTKGSFGCPQPTEIAAIVEPVDDIAGATGGWWKVSDSPPLEATLRACSDNALVEVDLEYEDGVDYEGDPRSQAVAIAELVLSALQG